ncbi:glycoside hydrolase family 130 protein [candidate division KSB1 bacterium]|nr:glycoside hydrolase family 130 protein [candidate division KSB1 bacterium]
MAIVRSPRNPIISPADVKPSRDDFQVVCVFNAGVMRFQDEVILALRVAEKPINSNPDVELVPVYDVTAGNVVVKQFDRNDPKIDVSDSRFVRTPTEQYLSSLSHIRLARSKNGVQFEVEAAPALAPANEYEIYGIEDPRITSIDDKYYISYSAISPMGSAICLASTHDFKTYQRHGVMLCPDNRDVEIFPERIHGKYFALHRPNSGEYGRRDIWIAESTDLVNWGNHRWVMGARENSWDNGRVGGSAIPFRVDGGWLEIYHGASKSDRYCLGAALLDANEPWKVLARSKTPIIEPEMDYETQGFFGNVIFNCGALVEDGKVKLYYGAADTHMCYAEIKLEEIIKNLA